MAMVFSRTFLPCSLVLIVGLATVVLAAPRLSAALTLLPTKATIKTFFTPSGPTNYALKAAQQAHIAALKWHASADTYGWLADVEERLAQNLPLESAERNRLLEQAKADVTAALMLAPTNPRRWQHLAEYRLALNESAEAAFPALALSVATGPLQLGLAPGRMRLGFFMWNALNERQRETIREAIRLLDHADRAYLVAMAKTNLARMRIIVAAMAEEPERFVSFIRALNRK